ncbi:MAG: hypothetical protein MZW92_34240 [Comamonadaceae bacterium]|nr:hypothetical protein [Comamonadaceae bacterium]
MPPLRVEHVAAAALRGPGQPAPADRRRAQRGAPVYAANDADLFAIVSGVRRGLRRATPSSRRSWSATGACAGCSRRACSASAPRCSRTTCCASTACRC